MVEREYLLVRQFKDENGCVYVNFIKRGGGLMDVMTDGQYVFKGVKIRYARDYYTSLRNLNWKPIVYNGISNGG